MNTLQYFGTDTISCGHYFFDFDSTGQYLRPSKIFFRDIPFDPESFTKLPNQRYGYKEKGSFEFHKIEGYSIIAIAGSPRDTRSGCKSVFWMKGDFTQDQLIQKIRMTPAAIDIVNKMPFTVKEFNHFI